MSNWEFWFENRPYLKKCVEKRQISDHDLGLSQGQNGVRKTDGKSRSGHCAFVIRRLEAASLK